MGIFGKIKKKAKQAKDGVEKKAKQAKGTVKKTAEKAKDEIVHNAKKVGYEIKEKGGKVVELGDKIKKEIEDNVFNRLKNEVKNTITIFEKDLPNKLKSIGGKMVSDFKRGLRLKIDPDLKELFLAFSPSLALSLDISGTGISFTYDGKGKMQQLFDILESKSLGNELLDALKELVPDTISVGGGLELAFVGTVRADIVSTFEAREAFDKIIEFIKKKI